jgi:DNA transposition AAA+ family ATPase
MNDPKDMPVDIDEMREWLNGYFKTTSKTWSEIASESGLSKGLLNSFSSATYTGNNENIARRIYQYRQKVESQAEMQDKLLKSAGYIETPTSRRIETLLRHAQMGRITVGAMGPGTSKTMTAKMFKAAMGETVWYVELLECDDTPMALAIEIAKAVGLMVQKRSSLKLLVERIIEKIAFRRGLIIIDEANHTSFKSLELLRGLHDKAQVGIALLGNEELLQRIRSGPNRHAYARLNRRIAHCHIQDLPTEADIGAFLDHLNIIENDMRRPLIRVGMSADGGGLGEVQQILESAQMAAIADEAPLSAAHVNAAIAFRTTSQMRRAA